MHTTDTTQMFTDGQAASTLKSANSYVSKLKTLVKVAKDV
jgi:hypothetical protein